MLGVGKLSDHAWVRWPAWAVVELFRAIPVLLLMVFIWYFIGIARAGSSFWAVVIALTLYNGSVLAEVLRAGVLAVPKGQREAAYAIGMRKTQVMNIVLMPQAVKIMLPAIISQCIVALKDTALGIYVLAPGLTRIYKQIYGEFDNRVPTMIVIASIYILVNLLLTALATWAQKRFVGEKKPLEVSHGDRHQDRGHRRDARDLTGAQPASAAAIRRTISVSRSGEVAMLSRTWPVEPRASRSRPGETRTPPRRITSAGSSWP